MNASLKTAGWLGAALPMLAAMIDVTPAQAQSSARELPAVVVDQPSRPPAARSRPAPRRQAASAASRRTAQRGQTAPDAAAAAGARAETGTGPVRGYLANQSGTGTKTDTPLRETPQSITVVTADRITDQGALTVQESLRYVPGVFADAYGLDSRGDYPRIRGQDPNIYLDGTRVVNTFTFNEWRPDPYTLERIEVLRGPSAMMYGQGSTGGVINMVSKRPLGDSQGEIGVQFGSYQRKQVQADLTGPLTADGQWLYRLVALARETRPLHWFLLGEFCGIIYWCGVCYWIQSVLADHAGISAAVAWAAFALFCVAKAIHMGLFACAAGLLVRRPWAVAGVAASGFGPGILGSEVICYPPTAEYFLIPRRHANRARK